MKAETDPITDDEWLLRRVWFKQFRTAKIPIISPNTFEPRTGGRDPDTDGISLYRAACLAAPDEVLATVTPDRRHEFGIVRVSVSFLKSLDLTVVISPDERVRGHVVIPELNAPDYDAEKAKFTPLKHALATEASKDENIVRRPAEAGGGPHATP